MQIISIAHTSPEGIKHQQIRPTIEVTQWSKDNVGYDEAVWEGPQYGTPEMVAYLEQLAEFLEGKTVWAYNAKFDQGEVEKMYQEHNIEAPSCKWVCAWHLYKAVTPAALGAYKVDNFGNPAFNAALGLENSNLTVKKGGIWVGTKLVDACKRFGIAWDESGAHSADYDVIMTSKVIGKCKEQLEGFGIVLEDTIDVILDVETTGFVKKSKAAPIKAKSKIKAGIWNRFQAFLTNWVG